MRVNVAIGLATLVAAAGITVGFAAAGTKQPGAAGARRPNIVFVLTDDLAWNLVKYMPHVRQMQQRGVTFSRYFVTDSLCCPSRASIFTGRYPHDTGVFTNTEPDGGFYLFHQRGEERSTFATKLQSAGYMTAMMGKYLNGYVPKKRVDGQVAYIPPGWNEWDVAGNGYKEFNYTLNENGSLVHYGKAPADYLTDVVAAKGAAFIDRASASRKPFLLEIATFAPHGPYTPAPRDSNDFPGLRAPRTPAYDEPNVSDKPRWLRAQPRLTAAGEEKIDTAFRKRAQAVEAVDDLLARLQSRLAADHQLSKTYIFFSSDNGYHMGDHRLMPGKQTAFETDIRVPLIVTGPKVARGRVASRIASNIDLYPTFTRLGHASVPHSVDGRNLAPLLGRKLPKRWRQGVLVEHHGPDLNQLDPDYQAKVSGKPPTYEALRTPTATYVEYANGQHEYYNLRRDRYELRNSYPKLSKARRASLHGMLKRLRHCHSGPACWRAAR
jgi:N-acetylglucosamine-6-sulfatase